MVGTSSIFLSTLFLLFDESSLEQVTTYSTTVRVHGLVVVKTHDKKIYPCYGQAQLPKPPLHRFH